MLVGLVDKISNNIAFFCHDLTILLFFFGQNLTILLEMHRFIFFLEFLIIHT